MPNANARSFIQNKGQIADLNHAACQDVLWFCDFGEMRVYVRNDGFSYVFVDVLDPQNQNNNGPFPSSSAPDVRLFRVDVEFEDANANPTAIAEGPLQGVRHYYLPHAPEGIEDVRSFERIKLENVYSGIDFVMYFQDGELKYDFHVAPNADPDQIRMTITGSNNLQLNNDGTYTISTDLGDLQESAPYSYQEDGQIVQSSFVLNEKTLRFDLGEYDEEAELIIDPSIEWWTYIGGSGIDQSAGGGTDINAAGEIVVHGTTVSPNFPTTTGLTLASALSDAFITKYDASGALVFQTLWGGTGGELGEGGVRIVPNASGVIWAHGTTNSPSVPTSGGVMLPTVGTPDAYLVRLAAPGYLLSSIVLGGAAPDVALGGGCAVDAQGCVYVHGSTMSPGFPTLRAFQPALPGPGAAYLTKFDAANNMIFSSFYGGPGTEAG
ncbi:MAG: hypothetical protein AAF570_24125, partial [Bacteroidota bacterium]